MLSIRNLTFALMLFVGTAFAEKPLSNEGGIHLVEDFELPKAGGVDKIHTITLNGYLTHYYVVANNYVKGRMSSATCGKKTIKGKDYPDPPCATSTKEHDQYITVSCYGVPNNATFVNIHFAQSGKIRMSGNGTLLAGFTNENSEDLQPVKGPAEPLIQKADDLGVVVNCDNKQKQETNAPSPSDPQK